MVRPVIKNLPYTREAFGNLVRQDFPEGEDGDKQFYEYRVQGDRSYFKYFIENMFIGPAGSGILQTTALITGNLGVGKTCLLTYLGWNIREIFGMPVSADFTALIPETFGEYEYLSDLDIVDEMVKISEASELKARKKLSVEVADALIKANGSKLYQHVVLWDEIYKKVSNRRGMENINLLVGDIMKQQRHFKSIFLFAAPAENELDKKMMNQYVTVDITGMKLTPNENVLLDVPPEQNRENFSYFHVYNRIKYTESSILLFRPPWHALFDSESPPTIRQKITTGEMTKAIKEVYCPECGGKYPGDHVYCGKCGVPLMRSNACTNPECGAIILPKYQYCPKCGMENKNYKGKKLRQEVKV